MGEEKISNFFFAHLKLACETGGMTRISSTFGKAPASVKGLDILLGKLRHTQSNGLLQRGARQNFRRAAEHTEHNHVDRLSLLDLLTCIHLKRQMLWHKEAAYAALGQLVLDLLLPGIARAHDPVGNGQAPEAVH